MLVWFVMQNFVVFSTEECSDFGFFVVRITTLGPQKRFRKRDYRINTNLAFESDVQEHSYAPVKQSFPTSFSAINGKNSGGQVPIGSFQVNSSYLNSLI